MNPWLNAKLVPVIPPFELCEGVLRRSRAGQMAAPAGLLFSGCYGSIEASKALASWIEFEISVPLHSNDVFELKNEKDSSLKCSFTFLCKYGCEHGRIEGKAGIMIVTVMANSLRVFTLPFDGGGSWSWVCIFNDVFKEAHVLYAHHIWPCTVVSIRDRAPSHISSNSSIFFERRCHWHVLAHLLSKSLPAQA